MKQVYVVLTDESLAIATQASAGEDVATWLSEQVNKMLDQKKVQFARSRLNLHKKTVQRMIEIGDWASVEDGYIKLGLSESVAVFGGIRKVYEDIYEKKGHKVPADKIRQNNVVVVND